MYDANGHEIILNDRVIVKHKGKMVDGRVLAISGTHPKVKVQQTERRITSWFYRKDVQVQLHWS